MSLLLQSGAQVNAVNSSQCSALHIAVNKQHVRCVQVLLRHGCDVNVQVTCSISNIIINADVIDMLFSIEHFYNICFFGYNSQCWGSYFLKVIYYSYKLHVE